MKKLISLILFIILLIVGYLIFSNRKKDYEVSYQQDGFEVSESYKVENSNYYLTLAKDDKIYEFTINNNYTKNRKNIDKINIQENDDYECVSIELFSQKLPYICNKDGLYYDSYIAGLNEESEVTEIRKVSQISVYNDAYDYYLWNGYGITSILDKKEYNFLSKESYDNNLSYQLHEYLIVADYDRDREFDKFYVFNSKEKNITEFKFDYKISFNSYFMGDYDDFIYLFDRKNKVQYKIDLYKNKISICSDNNGALYYKDGWETIGINKLVYNDYYFENTSLINYLLKDGSLYYSYMNSDINVLFDEGDISTILDYEVNDIFYLKKDELYKYNINEGRTLLLSYFEWNFSYSNKIFIFN
ncbi:MAG: hypothetical protein J1F35_02700 [Erysipelotrichales bacterium]|nr:hypothetical protein [Erysipelotrichales bacterium]